MSESDGIDDVLDGGMRQSLMIASRIAETIARRLQEAQRQREQQISQAGYEAQARLAADRSSAHAVLAPVQKDQWWDKAQARDIATAYAVAEGWKDHDPTALAAADKIRAEVRSRYGIDTRDVGADAAYLESGIQAIRKDAPVPNQPAKQPRFMSDEDVFYAQRDSDQDFLTRVHTDEWWDKAQPRDIANAHRIASAWMDHDERQSLHWLRVGSRPAEEKIHNEVLARYDIDTRNMGVLAPYLALGIQNVVNERAVKNAEALSDEEMRKAAAEHEKSMQLLAAARAEELRAQAVTLRPEMERHQVPAEYLGNPELLQALQDAHNAKEPGAVEAADATVQERIFLISKDGVNGPDIDQLREEITANVNGAGDEHFQDAAFVKAAQDLHEAKLLAEGGFSDPQSSVEQRYERAEKDLFARMEGLGREIENRVTGNDSGQLKNQGLKAETTSTADYGSAERQEAFAESLKTTGASETQVRGRVAAERSEGAHPSAALKQGKGPAKARKSGKGSGVGSERAKNGMSR